MKLLRDWGFTRQGWRSGERGEYLVLIQGLLLIALVMLPVYRPAGLNINSPALLYGIWGIAAILGVGAFVLIIKGLLDLGSNLTPLPYPKENGQLVQTGIYSLVRHPLYSGLILAALSWAIWQQSLFHLAGAAVLLVFLNAKASREEAWLSQKYPDYPNYQNRVKKLIPWLY
ncbi:methyltransferase family protein [Microcoleus sp. FACHB-672]|uniref:methyltransferase family protein n=1 Tax=Microcoleus sp. FACHB-672 TaxID=2692825 RepID=UPI0016838076|nr:isoprenylcysteine carboxylmethyltransferase family protein [Microcoleus sp. FACHB-672]MBD2040927.1 isoprenylcysteine carboxylmethyltransferase family protein [Microcoleus sp. FACHB-672]